MERSTRLNLSDIILPSCLPSNAPGVSGSRYETEYHTFLLFLALLIIFHNSIIIHVYVHYRAVRTFSNIFVVNLCTADLLTGIALIPSTVISASFAGKNNNFVYVYFAANVISDYCTALSVVGLTLVIGERYVSLCRPFYHERLIHFMQRGPRTRILICSIWVVILSIAVIPISWNYEALASAASNSKVSEIGAFNVIHSIVILSCCFLFPSALMLYFLLSMVNVTRQIRKNPNVFPRGGRDGQARITLLCLIMYVSFLSCWSPMMVLRLLIDIKAEPEDISSLILQGLFAMRCATSFLNPVWYAWLKKEYRKYMLKVKILRKVFRRTEISRPLSHNQEQRTYKETIWRETTL